MARRIGFELRVGELLESWGPIVVAFLVVTFARAMMVSGVVGALWPTRERLPWRWEAVLASSGLRGALSMVLVLALPSEFPARTMLVRLTLGVVALTLLVNGLSAGFVLRVLGVTSGVKTEEQTRP